MPFFDNQSRDELRRVYVEAWRKRRAGLPVEPLEAQVADVIALHPEYHAALERGADALERDYTPEGGQSNPFLHMGLHLAVRDQLATDRPAGIRQAFQNLADRIVVQNVFGAKGCDRIALLRRFHDQPFGAQFLKGLAHRRPANVESFCKIGFDQTVGRKKLSGKNELAQG